MQMYLRSETVVMMRSKSRGMSWEVNTFHFKSQERGLGRKKNFHASAEEWGEKISNKLVCVDNYFQQQGVLCVTTYHLLLS